MPEEMKKLITEAKALVGLTVDGKDFVAEEKANEVMNTTATGFGTELIPTLVTLDPMLDLLGNYSTLINYFPGNHGNDMPISAKVPVIGEADLFESNEEWTTGAGQPLTPSNNGPKTGEVIIVQGQYILTVSLSDRELNYGPAQLENIVKQRINRSFGRTIDAALINGDSATSDNINGTYNAKAYYTQAEAGLRKVGIANGTVNVGTLDAQSYLSVKGKIDAGYRAILGDLLFIENDEVFTKTLPLDEVITVDKFGPSATIHTGTVGKIWNIDITVARDFPLTGEDGKVGTTNDKGGIICVYKPAVQYGFGKPLQIEVARVPGKGVNLIATAEFGFTIANEVAGLGKTVGYGVNVAI